VAGRGPEFDTELELDGRRFEGVNGQIPEEDVFFSLPPDEDDEVVLGFDLPRSLAARAERDGTLVVTGRAEQRLLHPRDSPIAARLRLRPH